LGRIEIELTQTQPEAPFRLSLEIAIIGGGDRATRIERVSMSNRAQRFQFAVEGAPDAVTLDPDTWLLMRADFGPRN